MYATEKENEKGGVGIIPQTLIRCLTSNFSSCVFGSMCYNKDTKKKGDTQMKLANANAIRSRVIEAVMAYFVEANEDCGMIASNSFNFPIVAEDGEEGWVEVVVKVPKGTKDEEYDGYGRREQYELDLKEKAEKKAAAEKKKAEKIAKDKARREKAKKEGE